MLIQTRAHTHAEAARITLDPPERAPFSDAGAIGAIKHTPYAWLSGEIRRSRNERDDCAGGSALV